VLYYRTTKETALAPFNLAHPVYVKYRVETWSVLTLATHNRYLRVYMIVYVHMRSIAERQQCNETA